MRMDCASEAPGGKIIISVENIFAASGDGKNLHTNIIVEWYTWVRTTLEEQMAYMAQPLTPKTNEKGFNVIFIA